MATEAGHQAAGLIDELLEQAPDYDFYQALRLLLRAGGRGSGPDALRRIARVRPQLGLDYPENELVEIRRDERGERFEVVTTLEGLYGVNSPLPAHLTEELLDDEWDELDAPREFLDQIHHYLYPLLYSAWLKYRFTQNAIEGDNPDYWNILYSIGGFGDPTLAEAVPDTRRALRYVGLLSMQSKSAEGLAAVLRDYLESVPVAVEQCVLRWVEIPEDQRLGLGGCNTTLGEDSVLGVQIEDRSGKIEIHLGPIDGADYGRLFGDGNRLQFVRFLLGFYMVQPLSVDLLIHLSVGSHPSASLGGEAWSRLGEDTWLGGEDEGQTSSLRLRLQ